MADITIGTKVKATYRKMLRHEILDWQRTHGMPKGKTGVVLKVFVDDDGQEIAAIKSGGAFYAEPLKHLSVVG